MKKIIVALSLLVTIVLDAQEFDLNKYKYRYQRYQSAQINFNFNGNNTYRMDRSTYFNPRNNTPKSHYNTDKNNFNYSSRIPFYFTRTINTEKLQQVQSLNFSTDFGANNEIRNHSKNISANIEYSIDNRFYKDKNFYELNLYLYSYTSYNTDFVRLSYFNTDQRSNNSSGNFNISVGKGRGRLEYVTDAVTAMFLLQDLKKKAGIGNYTKEQIAAIAKGITRINTTRFIDFRYRLIDQLTLLDSTLKETGIVPTKAIQYFTSINDNWLYANRFQRMSGSRWSVNCEANGISNYYHSRSKASDTATLITRYYQTNNLYNGISLNYAWSKQMGLKVQNSLTASIKSGYNFITQQYSYVYDNASVFDEKTKPDYFKTTLNLEYAYLYQPNTRTYLTFVLNGNIAFNNSLYGNRVKNIDNSTYDLLQVKLSPGLNFFKFISPHLYYTFNTNAPIVCTQQKTTGDNRLTNLNTNYHFPISINMGITYNFF